MTYHLWVPLQKLSIEMVRLERNSAGGYMNEVEDEVHTGSIVATLLLISTPDFFWLRRIL